MVCNEKLLQCIIYIKIHKSENYKCEVTRYMVKKEKICIHVVSKYTNCRSNHQTTTFRCSTWQKTQVKAQKIKTKKVSNREERETFVKNYKDREILVKNHEDREFSVKNQNDKETTL